jgi:hypothetical protein
VGRRGRKRQLDLESEYWKLLQSGVGTVAACKLLGIGRKTGYRWRAENGGLPPGRLAESARSGRYLSLLERQRIATLRDRKLGVREIARRLGRSPSTISRELRRHLRPHDRGIYDGDLAHAREREHERCCPGSRSCGRSSRTSSRRSGVRRRSRRISGRPIRTGRTGTCVTRRSTRPFTTAGKAA